MPPASASSDRYSPPNQNSCECTGQASHSNKSPESRTTNPDTHRGRCPSCTPNTPRAGAPCRPQGPSSDGPLSLSPQICTTPHSPNPQTPTPRHAQNSANSSARASHETPPSSPALLPPCPCESPPLSSLPALVRILHQLQRFAVCFEFEAASTAVESDSARFPLPSE